MAAPVLYTQAVPTPYLRFVERDGNRILQQRWAVTSYTVNNIPIGQQGEWRDVPLRPENDPQDSE